MRRAALLAFLIAATAGLVLGATNSDRTRKLIARRPIIERIEISGNRNFDDNTIRKNLYSRENGFWQSLRLKRKGRYAKANLQRDKWLLEYFYRTEGFDDVDVEINLEPGATENQVVVKVSIDEGPLYKIAAVDIGGDIGAEEYPVMLAARELRVGAVYNSLKLAAARDGIKTVFANRGYPYAVIKETAVKDTARAAVAVAIDITRNQLALFGDVIPDTNLRTRPQVFRREITFKRNDIYTRDKFLESQQRLIRTGLFNFVTLRLPDSMSAADSLQPNFYISAVERPPRYVALGGGAAQDEEAGVALNALATFGDRNILGTARNANLSVRSNFAIKDSAVVVRPSFQFVYTEPYLFKIRMPLIMTFKYEPRAPSPRSNVRIRSVSADGTIVREFSLKTKLSTSLNFEEINITADTNATVTSDALRRDLGISVNRRFILQLERDSRPIQSRFNPRTGSYTLYRFEYVGGILGGDNDFIKLLYSWSRYQVFRNTTVFATRVRLGYVNEFGTSDDVPLDDRLFLGGAYSIRGFPESEFGPLIKKGEPLGGEASALLNIEARRQLVGKFWGALFVDFGAISEKLRRMSLDESAVTIGAGLAFMSPVGPLRLDYGQCLGITDVPDVGNLHVGILWAF